MSEKQILKAKAVVRKRKTTSKKTSAVVRVQNVALKQYAGKTVVVTISLEQAKKAIKKKRR